MADTFFFLKLDGIDGKSQDTDHSGEIDILSFSENIQNAGSYDAGTGGNTGKANFGDMHISKYVDKASPTLRQYCALGTAISTAKLSCNKQAGDEKSRVFENYATQHRRYIDPVERARAAAPNPFRNRSH